MSFTGVHILVHTTSGVRHWLEMIEISDGTNIYYSIS